MDIRDYQDWQVGLFSVFSLVDCFFMYFCPFYVTRKCSNTDKMLNLYLMWFKWFSNVFLCSFERATV